LVQKVPAPRAEPLVVLLAAQLLELLQAVPLQVVLPRAAQQPAVQLQVRQVAQQEQLLGQQALRQVQLEPLLVQRVPLQQEQQQLGPQLQLQLQLEQSPRQPSQ
jgi:hypothetical protein